MTSRTMQRFTILLFTVFLLCFFAIPAWGLDVTKCTAKANEDGGGIMGGTDTRVTWEAQADPEESISSLTIVFPEGTSFVAEDVQATVLDELNRLDCSYEVSTIETSATIHFDEPTPPGLLISLQFHNIKLPTEGGDITLTGSYTTAQGVTEELQESPSIHVITVTTSERIALWLSEQPFVQAWNSHKFLHLFFDPTIMVTSIPQVAKGWVTALGLVLCGIPMAVPLGFLFAIMRMSRIRILRGVASVYVNIIRGTPMFLQIYIAFFGLPLLGIALDNFLLGAIVMSINSGAYLCEIFRAGIQSINKGQFEAARSLGMSAAQTMIYIIVPQAFKRVLPTMTNEFILLYKDTSLLAAVGLMETVMYAKVITAATGNITPYIVAAMFYLVVTLPLSAFTRRLENEATLQGHNRIKDKKKRNKKPFNVRRLWAPDVIEEKDVLSIKTADL